MTGKPVQSENNSDVTRWIEGVMKSYETALLRYAGRLLNESTAAQDVVQDAFIKLYQYAPDRFASEGELRSWLYRVTHNRAVDYIRKESRLKVLHEEEAESPLKPTQEAPSSRIEKEDRWELLLSHVERLKPEEQQVIILRIQEGMSYRDIAEVTERSEGNVGCILHHAVKKLSEMLKRSGVVGS